MIIWLTTVMFSTFCEGLTLQRVCPSLMPLTPELNGFWLIFFKPRAQLFLSDRPSDGDDTF
ncbi:MAG: hypothetical protein ACSLFB_14470 [Acidimicrobiales bacterium]